MVAAVALILGIAGAVSQAYTPNIADLDATARASGNRRDLAEHIGESVFATEWPAEVSHISANELGSHLIVGIRIWGVKFHKPLTRDEFVDEVVRTDRQDLRRRALGRRDRRLGERTDRSGPGCRCQRRFGQADVSPGF